MYCGAATHHKASPRRTAAAHETQPVSRINADGSRGGSVSGKKGESALVGGKAERRHKIRSGERRGASLCVVLRCGALWCVMRSNHRLVGRYAWRHGNVVEVRGRHGRRLPDLSSAAQRHLLGRDALAGCMSRR